MESNRRRPLVVNRHAHRGRWDCDALYVGRGTAVAISEFKRGARDGTLLGNPWRKEAGIETVLRRYRRHLWRLMNTDPRAVGLIRSITPETLVVCSCAPGPCHADVIVDAWRYLQRGNHG